MDTTKYLVKLFPYDKFFFGGENTFGFGHQANYFVRSNFFPQQTALLGLVRYQLLAQSGDESIFKDNRIQNKDRAASLIGPRSFDVNGDFEFGAIRSLSPVFVVKDNYFYIAGNKEYHTLNEDSISDRVYRFLEVEYHNGNYLVNDYNPKFPLPDLLMSKNGEHLLYSDVFVEHRQVGIRKNYEGGTDEKAYYVQTFYKFKDGFGFAFIVELENRIAMPYGKDVEVKFGSRDIVYLGGERQAFKMIVEEFDGSFEELIPAYQPSRQMDKIVLVSDAYVERDITDLCSFAITETIDFRFFSLETDPKVNYYKQPVRTAKYNLYKKGSVFYGAADELDHVQRALKEATHFHKLGYNHFTRINKNS